MKILSVDWDYFFPNVSWYDWGHREAPFFIHDIWQTRVTGINLKTGANVFQEVKPDPAYKTFWERMLSKPPKKLVISESHVDIWPLVEKLQSKSGEEVVLNFDQHHDCGYYEPKTVRQIPVTHIDCADWCRHSPVAIYTRLVYPAWRKDDPEQWLPKWLLVQYNEVLPAHIAPDTVFVCRSGAWTPPWHDDAWMEFIGDIKKLVKNTTILRQVNKPRALTMQKALRAKEERDAIFDRLSEFENARKRMKEEEEK